MTVGMFSLLGRELTLTMVGAVLTIAGYSINDTIVVYDRIREGLASGRRGSIEQIMNESINQTLSRTILTSTVTLIPILCLLFLRRRRSARFFAGDYRRRGGRNLFVDLHRFADRALVDARARWQREQFAPGSDPESERHDPLVGCLNPELTLEEAGRRVARRSAGNFIISIGSGEIIACQK